MNNEGLSCFTNVLYVAESNPTLFKQEIDVIGAVVDRVLSTFEPRPAKGTFILDGQEMGKGASCILRFNLEEGQANIGIVDVTGSDSIAAEAIDSILIWPEGYHYGSKASPKFFGQLPSGIYCYDWHSVLVLNTTLGRFLASLSTSFPNSKSYVGKKETTALLTAVVAAFSELGERDVVLRRSVDWVLAEATELAKEKVSIVGQMFAECDSEAIKVWREWTKTASENGDLKLFFE